MEELILVEFGPREQNEPWGPKCVCRSERDAKEYRNLYRTIKLPYEGEEPLEEQSEYEYILDFVEGCEIIETDALHQLRSLWTAYCLHNDVDIDTAEYDNRIFEIWQIMQETGNSPYSSLEYERFYIAMGRYLI